MDTNLIPKVSSEKAKKNFKSVNWKIFSQKMQKNNFMRDYILKKYNSICPWCNRKILNRFVLHHIDYEHECINIRCIVIPHPTEKRPNGTYVVPNCEKCYRENIEAFNECARRVVPVHSLCNMEIDKISKKII